MLETYMIETWGKKSVLTQHLVHPNLIPYKKLNLLQKMNSHTLMELLSSCVYNCSVTVNMLSKVSLGSISVLVS